MLEVNIHIPRNHFDIVIKESFTKGITGVFGPSGSGKTSLLLAISGILKPSEGVISIEDNTIFDTDKKINIAIEKRNIGYVFQEGRLFPHLNVKKNLLYGMKTSNAFQIDFDEVVSLLQLDHLLESRPHQISGGEKQRVALGRTLLTSPDILLLDEPFSALDDNIREQILSFVQKIHTNYQIPILFVSHNLSDILKLTDNLLIIEKGKILDRGSIYDLINSNKATNVLGQQSIINAHSMHVLRYRKGENIITKHIDSQGDEVLVSCKQSTKGLQKNQLVRIFVEANDIAISTSKLQGVSIQNQLRGKIVKLILKEGRVLCHINNGLDWIVEISQKAKEELALSNNMEVYMLFKSTAVNIL